MRRLHLPIQEPCHENWNAMSVEGEARRFCGVCVKQVHDLSALTEAQARTVLAEESANGRMCVRYLADKTGNILFKPDTTSLWRHTLAAAGMALALMTGCTVKGGVGERPDSQEPYEPVKPSTEPRTDEVEGDIGEADIVEAPPVRETAKTEGAPVKRKDTPGRI